jgi:hypothetical protein
MKKKEYLLHLIGEISNFILDSGPNRMVVSLHQEEDGIHLAFLDDNFRSDKELEEIRSNLNSGGRPELAGYYGAMAGQDLLGEARLNLIGWQVKHADVSVTDSGTRIDLWLGGEGFDPTRFSIPGKHKKS